MPERPVTASEEGSPTDKRLNWALILIALGWGIAVHWNSFVYAPLLIDEHVSFWISDPQSPGTLLERSLQYSATPPLLFVVQRVSLAFLGRTEWALRLIPFLAYLISAPALGWWITRRVGGIAGGLAALLFAAHPAVSTIATQARPYSLGILISIVAMAATDRLCRAPESKGRWILWLVINAALVQTHYLFAFLWIAELIWLAAAKSPSATRRRTTLLAALGLALIGCSCLPGLLHIWEDRQGLNWTTYRTEWSDVLKLFFPVPWFAPQSVLWWAIVAVPIVLAGVSSRCCRSADKDAGDSSAGFELARLAIWFGAPVLVLWGLGHFWLNSLAADRYLLLYVPAVAGGLGVLLTRLPSRCISMAAAIVMLALAGAGQQLAHIEWTGTRARQASIEQFPVDESWRRAADILTGRSPGAIVLVASGLTEMTLVPLHLTDAIYHDYVGCRLGRLYFRPDANGAEPTRISLPMFWDRTGNVAGDYRQLLEETLARRSEKTIWLVAASDTDLLRNSTAAAEQLLKTMGATPRETWSLPGVRVVEFDRR